MQVKFKVKFMDWNKGDKKEFTKKVADKYIAFGVCDEVKPRTRQKKVDTAPNKMQPGAAVNK